MSAMEPVGRIIASAIAIGVAIVGSASPLRAQFADSGASGPAPRGQVVADCFGRAELWQGDSRMPVKLLYSRILFNETRSGGVQRDLASDWNKFVLPRLAGSGQQAGNNAIVYCLYADAANNTELARWPAHAPAAERLEWPGHSISDDAARTMMAANPGPL